MGSKVTIRAGHIEFSYEGENDLSTTEIKELFGHIEGLIAVAGKESLTVATSMAGGPEPNGGGTGTDAIKLHMNSIAEKLGAKSGSQLAVAAGASLQLVKGQDTFTRAELLAEMKVATKYYKQTMLSNLTSTINTLLSSKMNQNANDKYSLKAEVLASLNAQLAQ